VELVENHARRIDLPLRGLPVYDARMRIGDIVGLPQQGGGGICVSLPASNSSRRNGILWLTFLNER